MLREASLRAQLRYPSGRGAGGGTSFLVLFALALEKAPSVTLVTLVPSPAPSPFDLLWNVQDCKESDGNQELG